MKNQDQNKQSAAGAGENAKNKKKKKNAEKRDGTLIALWVLAGILALALVSFGVVMAARAIYNSYMDSGKYCRNDVIFESEHHELNAAMLSFCYHEYIRSGAYGSDYTDPELLKQTESAVSGMSLYEYYERLLLEELLRQMRFAEKATELGITLDKTDEAHISAHLASIESSLLVGGDVTLDDRLSAVYGRGVKMSDIEDMLRLEALADKLREIYETGITVSDEEINKRLEENDSYSYLRMDYYIVDFGNNILSTDDAATKALKEQLSFERAQKLAQSKTEYEFRALAKELFRQEFHDDDSVTEEDIDEMLEDDHYVGKEMPDVNKDDPASTLWLFSKDRKTGDVFVETTSPTVYFIARPFYSIDAPNDAYLIINVDYDNYSSRSAALDALKAVKDLYEESAKDEASFRALCKTYAESYIFASREGYYDNTATTGSFNTLIKNYVDSVETLGIGATFTVYGNEGAYFLYYLGKGEMRSRVEAREAVISDKFYDLYAALAKENKITYNSKTGTRSADLYVK